MKKPIIDESCIGCGVCVSIAPDVFEMGDDGKAKVIKESGFDESTVQEAIDQCPTQSIKWEE